MNNGIDQKTLWEFVDLGKLAPLMRERKIMGTRKHYEAAKDSNCRMKSDIKAEPWSDAAENLEWITGELEHVRTEMPFRGFPRIVPDMNRQDGGACERMPLQNAVATGAAEAAVSGMEMP